MIILHSTTPTLVETRVRETSITSPLNDTVFSDELLDQRFRHVLMQEILVVVAIMCLLSRPI